MRFLRSNTAVIVTVGPFYDKTDGVTIETALTITNEKITLTADTDAGSAPTNILDNVTGATSGTANDLNYITGNDAGMMQLELAAADVNRVGRMFLSITDAANHVPVFHEFFVLPQAIYDWLTGVIVPLPANVTQLLGTAWLTPATAGTPDVNAKLWNSLATVELPLVPTTAGRKLDVSAGGEAGIDFANIGSPTTTVDLSGTTISAGQKVDLNTIKTNAVVNGGTVTFPTTATLASTTNVTAGTMTTVTNLTNAPTAGDLTATMKTSVQTAADAAATLNTLINAIAGYIDTEVTDIRNRLPAALTAGGNMKSDALAVNGSTTAANNLKFGALGVVVSTCAAGSTTTSIVTNLTEATDDHYNGGAIVFTSGALLGQRSSISDYVGATKTLTVVALTEAPADTDGFIII